MRVFVLCAGRTGSVSLMRACAHMTNFTAAHESNVSVIGAARLDYPDQHIEVDNRLAWFLGGLDERYGAEPLYVHLRREPAQVAKSHARRRHRPGSIVRAFARSIYLHLPMRVDWEQVALDYVQAVDANIQLFMRDKPHTMEMQLETRRADFAALWERIGAEGDLDAALRELDVRHNASESNDVSSLVRQAGRAARRAKDWLTG